MNRVISPAPWQFERDPNNAELHRLRGTTQAPHEGYFRDNDGAWRIADRNGRGVAAFGFRGEAKRGQAYNTPDPEGQANATVGAAAPVLLALLRYVKAEYGDQWRDVDRDMVAGYLAPLERYDPLDVTLTPAPGLELHL